MLYVYGQEGTDKFFFISIIVNIMPVWKAFYTQCWHIWTILALEFSLLFFFFDLVESLLVLLSASDNVVPLLLFHIRLLP